MTTELRYVPCVDFEASVHAFVDGELSQPDSRTLLVHLELCDGCRDTMEGLRRSIRVHRSAADFEKIAATFDKDSFFAKLSGSLFTSNLTRLATMLYELGKAYFVAGNDSKILAVLQRKTISIERASAEGRRLVKETTGLAERAGRTPRRVAQSLKRTSQLFRGRETSRSTRAAQSSARIGMRSGRTALDNARRFLEEALILVPEHGAARLYLGVCFVRIDRPEEGIAEYNKILALPNLEPSLRVMTLQALGHAHGYNRDYPRAIEAFEEIRRLGHVENDPKFFTVLVSLAMFYAKIDAFERSTAVFGELLAKFPNQISEARAILDQAEVFRTLLRSRVNYRNELAQRYPVLFAG